MSRLRDDAGLTLVELMIVVLILGVVGGITVTGLVRGMQTSDRVEARVQTFTDLQRASERVSRDLRRGMWTPAATPASGCTVLSLAGDALALVVLDGSDRYRHSYTVNGDELRLDVDRWDGTQWVDLHDSVPIGGLTNTATEPVFAYLDADGTDLLADGSADPEDYSDVRKFQLRLIADVRDQGPVEVVTTVSARNGDVSCPVAS